jgi:hypothetical protein
MRVMTVTGMPLGSLIRNLKIVRAAKGPYTEVQLNGTKLTLLADSGSSVNILDKSSYQKVGKPWLTKMKRGKLIPYGEQSSLKVLGICELQIETKNHIDVAEFHVVEGRNLGSILGYPTASKLAIINVVHLKELPYQLFFIK